MVVSSGKVEGVEQGGGLVWVAYGEFDEVKGSPDQGLGQTMAVRRGGLYFCAVAARASLVRTEGMTARPANMYKGL